MKLWLAPLFLVIGMLIGAELSTRAQAKPVHPRIFYRVVTQYRSRWSPDVQAILDNAAAYCRPHGSFDRVELYRFQPRSWQAVCMDGKTVATTDGLLP